MPKLTRQQIKEVRKQAKETREKEEEAENSLIDCEAANSDKIEKEKIEKQRKSDKLGFTHEERSKVKTQTIDNRTVNVSWNISVGDLVYLPDESIGLVVKEDAKNIKTLKSSHDNKRNLSNSHGKVFVITSTGNSWFYPSRLKRVLLKQS